MKYRVVAFHFGVLVTDDSEVPFNELYTVYFLNLATSGFFAVWLA